MNTSSPDFVVKLTPRASAVLGVDPKSYPDRRQEAERYPKSPQFFAGINYKNDTITINTSGFRKHELGIFIGPSPKFCDIVIPDNTSSEKESPAWGLITYDAYNRLIYRDVRHPPTKARSTNDEDGVSEDYDHNDDTGCRESEGSYVIMCQEAMDQKSQEPKDQEKRRGFTWILSGPAFLSSVQSKVTIYPYDHIGFEVCIPTNGLYTKEHVARVKRFQSAPSVYKMDDPRLADFQKSLCLAPNAWAQNGLQTCQHEEPKKITLKGRAGLGAFGQVWWHYNVSTGRCTAVKSPHDRHSTAQALKEIKLYEMITKLAGTDNKSKKYSKYLIKFFNSETAPSVKLELEYALNGTLKEQHEKRKMCIFESLCALEQILRVTSFLHRFDIAHRDIKPENVLVKFRAPKYQRFSDLQIRLADLGSGKLGDHKSNDVGTFRYNAPELFLEKKSPYTKAVDIWSTGVMFFDIVFGLNEGIRAFYEPLNSDKYVSEGTEMCEMIAKSVERMAQSKDPAAILARFLRNHMVQLDASKRLSADDCLYKLAGLRHRFQVQESHGVDIPDGGTRQGSTASQVVETPTTIAPTVCAVSQLSTVSTVSTASSRTMPRYSSRSTATSTILAHTGADIWPTHPEGSGPTLSNTSSIDMPDVTSGPSDDSDFVYLSSDPDSDEDDKILVSFISISVKNGLVKMADGI